VPAFALFGIVLAAGVATVVASAAAGVGVAALVDSFVITNLVIGLSCGVAGVLIGWQRPRNPVGWLLLAAAVCQTTSAVCAALASLGAARTWPEPLLRSLATGFAYAWPWSIAIFLPLALLTFPDGLLPGRLWRAMVAVVVVTGPVFVLEVGSDPVGLPTRTGPIEPWLVLAAHAQLDPLWTAEEVVNLAVVVIATAGLVLRYRRGDEQRRRQLLWLVLALVVMSVVLVPWALFNAGPVLGLLAIALVPTAMTIAVLRHQLLDIRLVLSRTVLYVLLTAAVIGVYLGLVAVADSVLRSQVGPGSSVLATLVIAIGFNPVRVRLQTVVDRALYGDRADPVRALSRMGERLAGSTDSDAVLAAVCDALRLPYAALRRDGAEQAHHGNYPELLELVPLAYQGQHVGELIVGTRRGQRQLDRADRSALELLAAPLAVAVHATALSETVQRSRQHIVAAREEERQRLRRDLHDGLGPALTGISFQADAAGNFLNSDPGRAGELLWSLRAAATGAITDVRRLVYALRPPALDELGLVGALRRHAEQLGTGPPTVTVRAPQPLPRLSAAVEVAAYRIAIEALTNAVRHSGAARIDLSFDVTDGLELAVVDDGPASTVWSPGVGLLSMQERAAELGGTVTAGPDHTGGRVTAKLPL